MPNPSIGPLIEVMISWLTLLILLAPLNSSRSSSSSYRSSVHLPSEYSTAPSYADDMSISEVPRRVLRKGMNADDVRRLSVVECRQLTAKQVNNILAPEACYGFTSRCLEQFKVTNLNPECAMSISSLTIAELPKKTFLEMIRSDADHIFLTVRDLDHMLHKFDFTVRDFPPTFVSYCARNRRLANSYIKGLDGADGWPLLNLLFSPQNMAHLEPAHFSLLSRDTPQHLNPQAFREMSKEQLGSISPVALVFLSPAQISQIPPKNFEALTKQTIHSFSKEAFTAISPQQARFFGPDPALLPQVKTTEVGTERELEILDRRIFLENHPCLDVKKFLTKYKTSSAFNEALSTRCGPIWNPVKALPAKRAGLSNSAGSHSSSIFAFAAAIAFLLLI